MPRRSKVNHGKPDQESIISEILKIAAREGGDGLTPARVAKVAGYDEKEIWKYAADRRGLVALVFDFVDEQVAASGAGADSDSSFQDRLFDVLMARFDVLQAHREGFLALKKAIWSESGLTFFILPILHRSMNQMVAQAGGSDCLTVGVLGVYLLAVRVWAMDSSSDLSATMSELDRRLSQMAGIYNFLSRSGESSESRK